MNAKLVQLERWGCDVKGALPRFLNDEEFMLECIVQVSQDPAFDELGRSIEAGKTKEAFDAAHTLKGIIANTGLTPLLVIIVAIVELLRRGSTDGLSEQYAQLMQTRQGLIQVLECL